MSDELKKKVERAIRLLRFACGDEVVEVSYSGGKDSDVILELARMAGIKYRAIYKNTTIDPPGTIKHCRDKGVEILQPCMSFFEIVKKKGMPTRRARFCCEILKEYKVLDKAIQGIRRSESGARARRYSEDDPIICRVYGKKENHVNVILPILSWTDDDVAEFVKERNIKCHPLYYDEMGNFRPERRLGCMGCPMRNDGGRADFLQRPKLLRAIAKAQKYWWNTHPGSRCQEKFGSYYGLIAHNLFFHRYADFKAVDSGMFGSMDWKTFLEKHFNIELP